MFKLKQITRQGFSLIELVLVVMILAILAGLVIPLIGNFTPGGNKTAEEIVTETSMLALRDALMGTGSRTGLWADLGHQPNRLPRTIAQMFASAPPDVTATPLFDPVTKIGWRGPYLRQPTGTYPNVERDEVEPDKNPLTGNFWEDDGFLKIYGTAGDLGLVDAWGLPIVLQIDFDKNDFITAAEAMAARLVSAGPNGKIDWELDINNTEEDYRTASQNHLIDDVVMYLGIVQ